MQLPNSRKKKKERENQTGKERNCVNQGEKLHNSLLLSLSLTLPILQQRTANRK